MLNSISYKAIEDNSGGLHLFVFEDVDGDGKEKVIYEHSGYEYVKGQLNDDLKALHNGGHPEDWDGCEENPERDYEHMINSEYGYKIIAACDYHRAPEIFQAEMGLSGLREFDLNNG